MPSDLTQLLESIKTVELGLEGAPFKAMEHHLKGVDEDVWRQSQIVLPEVSGGGGLRLAEGLPRCLGWQRGCLVSPRFLSRPTPFPARLCPIYSPTRLLFVVQLVV